jgi:hypothetical protein
MSRPQAIMGTKADGSYVPILVDPAGKLKTDVSDKIADLPELVSGIGTIVDTATSGLIKVNSSFTPVPASIVGLVNTAVETSMIAPVLLPANSITLKHRLMLEFSGNYTNTSGANRDITFKIKIGSNTIGTFVFTAIPSGANPRGIIIKATIGFIDFIGVRANGTCQAFAGAVGGSGLDFGSISKAIDSSVTHSLTIDNNLDITAQHGAALTTASFVAAASSLKLEVSP